MSAWLPLILLFAKLPVGDASLHKIDVRIAGPLAMVEVWRSVEASVRTSGARQVGSYFDLNLPEGAALLDWELIECGASRPCRLRSVAGGSGDPLRVPISIEKTGTTGLTSRTEVEATAGLSAMLKMRQLSPAARPAEEGTDFRIHATPIGEAERVVLHYRYSALAGCKDGRLSLRVPDSLEETPAPADVSVTIEPLPDGAALAEASLAGKAAELKAGARKATLRGPAPMRAAWEVSWRYAKPAGTLPGTALAAAARVEGIDNSGKRPRKIPRYALAGLACGAADVASKAQGPERVLLLVDRSRSVGQGGLSAERLLAREVVEALPPSVSFNAILFGAKAEPVFPLPRMPTREALTAFVNAADPNRLENGTDLTQALGRARTMLAGDSGAGPAWVVLITDGALPASQTYERMQKALAPAGGDRVKVLVLLVRQHGDEEVAPAAVAEYARFARGFGGVVRVVPASSPRETARAVVAAMARGGDLLDLRLEEAQLSVALPPGQGASLALTTAARLPREPRVRFTARGFDGEVTAELAPALVKREWIEPLVENLRVKRRAWSGATSGMAVTVLPGPQAEPKPADGVVRGHMDPNVLRNALALAFTPRARACYLSRRAAKAADVYLRGRLKLELTLERGELHDAVVRHSTLGKPDIENCVRDAAWAVEYPRPEHRDAPTVANVNLVFSPRTERERAPDASPADREIDLILGPLTFPGDFTDLLEQPGPKKSPTQ